MPPEARVLIAEDDPMILKDMKDRLVEAGHMVVSEATTLNEARAMISRIQRLEEQHSRDKVVFVLGGNLGGWLRPDHPQNDSQILLRELRDAGLGDIKTVGYSGNEIPGVTLDVGKQKGSEELAEAITNL